MVEDFGPHIVLYKIDTYVHVILILTYLLIAIGLKPGGSSTVHIYTQTIHRTKQLTTNWEECGPCPVFASYTLAVALPLREKHGKNKKKVCLIQCIVRSENSDQCCSCIIDFYTLAIGLMVAANNDRNI